MVFTACVDGNVRAWDARTGECQNVLTGHNDMILDLRLVNLRSQQQQAAETSAAAAGGVGDELPVLFVTASDDQTAKVFRWPDEDGETSASGGTAAIN